MRVMAERARSAFYGVMGALLITGALVGCSGNGNGGPPPVSPPPTSATLTIAKAGSGTGAVTSTPAGLDCGSSCTLTVSSGTVVTLAAAPAPNNTLADWGGACPTASATCEITVTTSQTVTATFNTSTANPGVTVTLAGTGIGSVSCNGAACSTSYPWGTSVTFAATSNGSSFFAGWSGGLCSGTTDCTVVLWDDILVTATFTQKPVTAQLSVTKSGTGSGSVTSNPAGITCGATCTATMAGGTSVTLTAAPATGSVFQGWSGGGCSGTGTCTVTLNANTAVTATFNQAPPTVSFTLTTPGTGTGTVTCNGGTCNSSYPSGTPLTLVAAPSATSLFSGWGGACASAGTATTCSLTLNANTTVSAPFHLPTLSVVLAGSGSVTSSPVGINCGATCIASFAKGTAITLTATGANFSGWSGGGCSGTSACVVTLDNNSIVTASFSSGGLPPFAQQAYLKASNTGGVGSIGEGDSFGRSIALDGDTLVVGAINEDSSATGVNGNQTDNNAVESGAVYVFVRSGGVWTQQAYLKASNAEANDQFGFSVALSGDTLVVGAYNEDSSIGVTGGQASNNLQTSGAAYVFTRTGAVWTQQAFLKASNPGELDAFGWSVAISGDTIAIGAINEDSNATGVGGNQTDNSVSNSGAVYVFTRVGGVWAQQAYLKASNTGINDAFGTSLALEGDTLVVGASKESSNATGVNGNQADNSAIDSGAVYVFTRTGGVWSQQGYLKASNSGSGDLFGTSVAVSGNTLVVGAPGEGSSATGVNGNQLDNSAGLSGAAYLFTRVGNVWAQQAYLKASNAETPDRFGHSVGLFSDTLVVGSQQEWSNATGVNGNQLDNSAAFSGAAYVFTRAGGIWTQRAYVKASNTGQSDLFGTSVAVSGSTFVVGATGESSNASGVNGDQVSNAAQNSGATYVFIAQ